MHPTHSCRQHEDGTIRIKQIKISIKTHNEALERQEKFALQRLRKKIRDHRLGGTILNRHVAGFHLVCDEEIMNVKRTRSFTGTPFTVYLQNNRALVILKHSVNLNSAAL